MLIKVDEDLPRMIVALLRERGHDAAHVVEQGMGGYQDASLWQAVQAERRYLVTADKGFADVRLYVPGTHAGILLLRPDRHGIRPVVELLENALATYDLEALVGTVAIVTPQGIRIRRTG